MVVQESFGKALNVLLVEDDELDVMNVQRAFRRNNIPNTLYTAENGIEALEMLRGESSKSFPRSHRLILLDLNMPRMGGIEFLRELRQDPELRRIPVVVLTSSDEERDKAEAFELGVQGYILKPVSLGNFLETMVTLNKYWSLCELPS